MPTDLENFIFSGHDPSIAGEIAIPTAPLLACTDMQDVDPANNKEDYECVEWSVNTPVPFLVDATVFYNITFFVLTVIVTLQVIRFFFSRAGKV